VAVFCFDFLDDFGNLECPIIFYLCAVVDSGYNARAKWSRAASMSWGVVIGGFVDGEREPILAMYLVQLTHLEV